MIDWANQDWSNQSENLTESSDQDFGSNQLIVPDHHEVLPINKFSTQIDNSYEVSQYNDPLKYTHKFNFKPCILQLDLD